jgi:hypothetical protein
MMTHGYDEAEKIASEFFGKKGSVEMGSMIRLVCLERSQSSSKRERSANTYMQLGVR